MPDKFPEANVKFGGRKITKREVGHGYDRRITNDVYAYQDDMQTIFKVKAEKPFSVRGFLARLIFVITGEIWFTVHGPKLPAFAVGVGKVIKTKMVDPNEKSKKDNA